MPSKSKSAKEAKAGEEAQKQVNEQPNVEDDQESQYEEEEEKKNQDTQLMQSQVENGSAKPSNDDEKRYEELAAKYMKRVTIEKESFYDKSEEDQQKIY